jgi:superfamily II DNA/RNA helicase
MSLSEEMKEAKGMIFSATVPLWIQKLAVEQFSNPVLLDLIGTETNQLPEKIKHRFVVCENDNHRMDLIFEFVHQNPEMKTIVFTETKLEADTLTSREKGNFKALHGDLDQKLRKHAIDMFRKKGSSVVLVATDVASRGLDIQDVDVVIQMGCRNVDSFVHRSGRTGRAGKDGLNFVITKRDNLKTLGKYASDLNIKYEIASTLTN